ncbi:MAG: sulfotransferase family protein [Acidimicrobiales bacterium]
MEVIGTGFGRTGTLSTKHALERLGFGPCHHMYEAIRHPGQFRHYAAHLRGEPVDWAAAFAGYRSQVDFPGATIWRELWAAFPDARILHTVRDPERWYESTRATIYPLRTMIAPWVRRVSPFVDQAVTVTNGLIWDGLFEGRFEDRDRAIEIYQARTAEVVAAVPADRLLVFDVADGWEPLCGFLGVAVPDEPFPCLNDRATILRRFGMIRTVTYGAPWAAAGLAATAGLRLAADRHRRPARPVTTRRRGGDGRRGAGWPRSGAR